MTKMKLNWKLKQLPTASEVADLVSEKIITPEEARGILFKGVDESEQVEELQRQIEFLEKVVSDLSKQNRTTITYTPIYPKWTYLSTYGGGWMSTAATTGENGIATSYSVNTANLLK